MYVPLLSLLITNGRMTDVQQDLVADHAEALYTAAPGWGYFAPPESGRAVVASATYGYATPITQIRVGNVIDTQQRRRDSLVEVYETRLLDL